MKRRLRPFRIKTYHNQKNIPLPTYMDRELAEIVGIHFGDGYMSHTSNHTYILTYAFDAREPQYAAYVKELFEKTLGIALLHERKAHRNCITLNFRSKKHL